MTTDQGPNFCPRCGTALVAGLSFCPACGYDTAEIGQPSAAIAASAPPDRPVDPVWPLIDPEPSTASSSGGATTRSAPDVEPPPRAVTPSFERRPSARTLIIGAVVVAVGLLVFTQLGRPRPGTTPPAPLGSGILQQPGASAAGPALIVGLTIQSPQDGQQVATKDVTVIGVAPPGLTITRDVSLGLDQHATSDGTGHWAMSVGLNEGENKLKFRIGDDRSTEQTLRVIYTPQP
jgi:hypothetical protein